MDDSLERLLSDLITAYHILHSHGVLDKEGQVSVRNPRDSSTFFISNTPAILVSSKSDLSQWYVADGSPVAGFMTATIRSTRTLNGPNITPIAPIIICIQGYTASFIHTA